MRRPAVAEESKGQQQEQPQEQLNCEVDQGFAQWMAQCDGSVAISTYQAGFLFMVGWNGRQVSFLPRRFARPMGIDVEGDRMALATQNGIWLFGDAKPLAYHYREPGRYDSLYLPRATYYMPELQLHDVSFAGEAVWFVNTRMSCLATLSTLYTFEPRWRPNFISELAPEDRCHLNGLAMRDGKPAFVTALARSDAVGGWRSQRATGGVVIDVDSHEVVCEGLAMPHSPRWHRDRLWLLNAGAGQLLRVGSDGKTEVICELPGYLRGLCFAGDYALVAMSKIRETNIFGGMPVETKYPQLTCGVAVVDIRSGRTVGTLRFTAGCSELYDLRFIPGVRRPNVLNLEKEDTAQAIFLRECGYWLRPEFEVKAPAS
jgi:uncharacterized protein (TIGR03032 family)